MSLGLLSLLVREPSAPREGRSPEGQALVAGFLYSSQSLPPRLFLWEAWTLWGDPGGQWG